MRNLKRGGALAKLLRISALTLGATALLAFASPWAAAQQFVVAPEAPRTWYWRAWLYSSMAPAVTYAPERDDRHGLGAPGLGANVTSSLGDGITASLSLRSDLDLTGAPARGAFLTLTLPLFHLRENPGPPAAR